ncbi:MAG: GNAT family N-acetyltransferase [Pikeienuella sp.]|uniref:GNAT family N-acetyltransferase n=1 Tax=Pikeienuella sp. TaxID=2831957 RepID=UPI0039191CF7
MRIDAGRFTLRLAESEEDVAAAQRLRYRVFVEEMGARPSEEDRALRRERDAFDRHFDHLLLIDNEAKPEDPLDRVAGVYRLLRGAVARKGCGFYGESEYDLTKIKNYPRETMELGRSCVGPEYRGGAAMHLLWTGLGQYVADHGVEIMFGVASFHGNDPAKLAVPLSWLHWNHLAPEDLRVRTREEFFVPMDVIPPEKLSRAEAMRQIPPLIKAYIRLGGFVGDGAFIDHAFNTVDVCLLMDTTRMVNRYRDFYQRESRGATDRILG